MPKILPGPKVVLELSFIGLAIKAKVRPGNTFDGYKAFAMK